MILLGVFRQLLTSKSAFSTCKHHFRVGQNRVSPLGVIFKLETSFFEHRKLVYGRRKPVYGPRKPVYSPRKPVYGLRKRIYGPRKPIYRLYLVGGFAPRNLLWRLRSLKLSMCLKCFRGQWIWKQYNIDAAI